MAQCKNHSGLIRYDANNFVVNTYCARIRKGVVRSMYATTAPRRAQFSSSGAKISQQNAYNYYARKNPKRRSLWNRLFGQRGENGATTAASETATRVAGPIALQDRNIQMAWYSIAIVVGVLGATYASVPLYKVFCQATGFGGTTQRVGLVEYDLEKASYLEKILIRSLQAIKNYWRSTDLNLPIGSPSSGTRVHTWTDEDAMAKLSQLRPVSNANLINVYFDTTTSDVLPWSFTPIIKNVKVVPGETSLSFFRVTNHSDKPITGVATYNVHPPKMGLYFQKVQCFCFEEQRLLPGETVDMPVFYFVDPEMLNDPQVSYVTNITLSYTFFMTDEEDGEDDDDDDGEDDDDDDQDDNIGYSDKREITN